MADPYDLDRFLDAQASGGIYAAAEAELRRGRKEGHWMWFVFPQIAGLGTSVMSVRYAIGSLAEARAYREHPVLGPRLVAVSGLVLAAEAADPEEIFGSIDALKLHSSMTLFALCGGDGTVFRSVLEKYFSGELDQATVRLAGGDGAAR